MVYELLKEITSNIFWSSEKFNIGDSVYFSDIDCVIKLEIVGVENYGMQLTCYEFTPLINIDDNDLVDISFIITSDYNEAIEYRKKLAKILEETKCPEKGSFIAYKKVMTYIKGTRKGCVISADIDINLIATLEIPEDARRLTSEKCIPINQNKKHLSHKCRSDKAKVLRIESIDGKKIYDDAVSIYNQLVDDDDVWDDSCVYKTGEVTYADNFDPDPNNSCSHGIHFFMRREDAVNF